MFWNSGEATGHYISHFHHSMKGFALCDKACCRYRRLLIDCGHIHLCATPFSTRSGWMLFILQCLLTSITAPSMASLRVGASQITPTLFPALISCWYAENPPLIIG